jgi:hypothetical protein
MAINTYIKVRKISNKEHSITPQRIKTKKKKTETKVHRKKEKMNTRKK